jgi:hypothetical protein
MRVMMLMYPGPEAETQLEPTNGNPDLLTAMMAFNQRMIEAGVLLSGDGLKPTRNGKRVRFGKGKPVITDGPFTETKEILGGFWMLEVETFADAVRWASEAPCPAGEMIEVRQVYEPEDFGPEIAEKERQMIRDISAGKKRG